LHHEAHEGLEDFLVFLNNKKKNFMLFMLFMLFMCFMVNFCVAVNGYFFSDFLVRNFNIIERKAYSFSR